MKEEDGDWADADGEGDEEW